MERFSTESLNIGDEVIIVTYSYGENARATGKITKKTPTGRVDVKIANGGMIRFASDGREYGGKGYLVA